MVIALHKQYKYNVYIIYYFFKEHCHMATQPTAIKIKHVEPVSVDSADYNNSVFDLEW